MSDSLARREIAELQILGRDTLFAHVYDRVRDAVELLTTYDLGASWRVQRLPRLVYRLSLKGGRHLVGAGYRVIDTNSGLARAVVHVSTDMGGSWQQTLDTAFTSGLGPNGLSMADSRFGILHGAFSQAWATTDGGLTWATDSVEVLPGLGSAFRHVVAFPDGSALAAMGAEVITSRYPKPSSVRALPDIRTGSEGFISFDPISGQLTVRIAGARADMFTPLLYDAIGRRIGTTIRRVASCSSSESCWSIDPEGLPRGRYFIVIPQLTSSAALVWDL